VVLAITRLRAERARLLGFDTHAHLITADETAKTPDAVAALLRRLAGPAARNARAEKARLQELADADGDALTIESHDWAFYTERARRAEFDLDTAAMRPYFEAERVLRDGVFYAANRLYGITMTERTDLVGYHPDVRVFEVQDADGSG